MQNNALMLLSQLVNSMKENFSEFEKAYKNSDKEKFDKQKKILLELQNKISFVLK